MNEGSSTSTAQPADRPTRAAVVLTLAMTALPLLPLLVSAAGCGRGASHASVEARQNESESAAAPTDATPSRTSAERSPR